MRFLRKMILTVLAIAVVLVALFYGAIFLWDQSKNDYAVVDADEGNTLADTKDDLLFLLVGVDDVGEGKAKRTDTMMLFRVNFQNGAIQSLSIPRDTRCYVLGDLDKINHAYAYGGIDLTMRTVRTFLGLDVDYYAIVDYEAVRAVIDAAGGVVYTVPDDLTKADFETFPTGTYRMNGDDALGYLRHRKGYADGDLGRVRAQQAFLAESMRQVLDRSNMYRYPLIAKALMDHVVTNIPAMPMLLPPWNLLHVNRNIESHILPGSGEYVDGVSYYIPASEEALDLTEELFEPYVMQ